eukprot:TRINITY_DN2598_c0_g2_i7.p1 TRINITY_DN2598_c0_g2~~TRINITY_DN2598_c0_g2_i7.p1  ORF type:complete len:223 (+),score=34.74 TRINITY_DN2598_c0_g2_i7:142-810(+)
MVQLVCTNAKTLSYLFSINLHLAGKTSICTRFTEDQFDKQYKQTIGCDFFVKHITLPGNVHVALQIWDIGGQTIGSKMIGKYIFGAHAVLLAYDITKLETFQNLEDWLRIVRTNSSKDVPPLLAVVGNKSDLAHLRAVKLEKHNQFSEAHHMQSHFISAKTGDNVNTCFYRICAELANVPLTKAELESTSQVVQAEIVNHPQNDPHQRPLTLTEENNKCILQ